MILDGKIVAQAEKARIKEEMSRLGLKACLAAVLVGDDPASQIYVASKEKDCHEVGIDSRVIRLPGTTTQAELLKLIAELNADDAVSGILVQVPLPKQIDESTILAAIDPLKDADCFHPENFGLLFAGNMRVAPCTPYGVIRILEYYKIDIAGKNAVILGRSNIVGKPMAALLLERNATVTICHSRTQNLKEICQRADILVAAIGKPEFVTGDMVKEGAVVIDVGINRVEDQTTAKGYRVVGDVNFAQAEPKAAWITPVPGGVGIMTRAILLENNLRLAKLKRGLA